MASFWAGHGSLLPKYDAKTPSLGPAPPDGALGYWLRSRPDDRRPSGFGAGLGSLLPEHDAKTPSLWPAPPDGALGWGFRSRLATVAPCRRLSTGNPTQTLKLLGGLVEVAHRQGHPLVQYGFCAQVHPHRFCLGNAVRTVSQPQSKSRN